MIMIETVEIIIIMMSMKKITMNLKVKAPTTILKEIITGGIVIVKEMIIIQVIIMAIKRKDSAMQRIIQKMTTVRVENIIMMGTMIIIITNIILPVQTKFMPAQMGI